MEKAMASAAVLLVLVWTAMSQEGPLSPIPSGSRTLICPAFQYHAQDPVVMYSIPTLLKPKADKKARLMKLLRESLLNDATAINDVKHEGKLDVKVEQEIKELAKEFSK